MGNTFDEDTQKKVGSRATLHLFSYYRRFIDFNLCLSCAHEQSAVLGLTKASAHGSWWRKLKCCCWSLINICVVQPVFKTLEVASPLIHFHHSSSTVSHHAGQEIC